MQTYAFKKHLILPKPTMDDYRGDRERITDALKPEKAEITLSAMQTLYPLLSQADYDITVTMCPGRSGMEIIRVEAGDTTGKLYGAALDIGSTTLELELVDMLTGSVLHNTGCVNAQTQFGLNILDRIIAVKEDRENLKTLQRLVTENINTLLQNACEAASLEREEISALIIGGNTTMIHFLMGCDPWLVFQSPYAPVFFDPGIVSAKEIGVDLCCNVYCFPAVANYLGGDITAGLLLTDLDTTERPSIFLDIGTNGELALGCRDYLLVGAGAAGPALEGFGSKYGMRAETGAIRHLKMRRDGVFDLDVIGGGSPVGICGTGIFDLVAECFRWGIINGKGTVNPDAGDMVIQVWNEETLRMVPAIVYYRDDEKTLYFTENDIHEFIKCKAAAHTMVATLLDHCGLTMEDIGAIYLAGGFGTHIDLESAVTVGIYPDIDRKKLIILGNTSLAGAKKLLMDRTCFDRIHNFITQATYLHFSEMEKFLENMVAAEFIPHTNIALYPSVKRYV